SALLARVWKAWTEASNGPDRSRHTTLTGAVTHHAASRRPTGNPTPPAPGGIDLAIDAYGHTAGEVLDALCAAAGGTGTRPADLFAQTRRRDRPLVALIDGIDNARDPKHLVTTLLTPLARATVTDHLRLVLGARASSLGELVAGAVVVDLDRPEYTAPA